MKKNILCIIPARGGSTGLRDKNFKLFNTKKLLSYPLDLAKKVKKIDKIVFTSDSDKYLNYVKKNYNIETIKRSNKLSSSNAKISSVINYIIDKLGSKNQEFDIILMLEPTSPLTTEKDLNSAINLLKKNYKKIDGVCPVVALDKYNPAFSITLKNKLFNNNIMPNNINRQEKDTYYLSGNFYLTKTSSFKKNCGFYSKKTLAYKIAKKYYSDIDDWEDFKIAEFKKNIYKI
jgi:CMP-N,N'-diacetyllegionaminic acid synthase